MRYLFVYLVFTLFAVNAVVWAREFNSAASRQSVTKHFAVTHNLQAADAEKISEFLEITYSQFFKYFENNGFNLTAPEEPLNWICFNDLDSFGDYANQTENMNLSWLSSYYSAKTNSVAILLDLPRQPYRNSIDPRIGSAAQIMAAPNNDYDKAADTIRIGHELAHQLAFNTGLQKRRVMYPLWVSEGLATNFEMQLNGDCRGPGCRKLTKTVENLIPLSEFITMTQLPSDSKLHPDVYAQAQALFNYLITNHTDQLRLYMASLQRVEPGWRSADTMLAEFTDVFGPINKLEKEWNQYAAACGLQMN